MPSHGGHKTRRGRFLWLRRKYRKLEEKWVRTGWRWGRDPVTFHAKRLFRVRHLSVGPIVTLKIEPPNDFVSGFDPWFLGFPAFTLHAAGYASPPFVEITSVFYLEFRADGKHQRKPLVGFQKKAVKRRKKPARNQFWTAFNRQVAGCNYFFHFNGCFPDTDVLGRRPNQTDLANGAPPATIPWPVPSGFN